MGVTDVPPLLTFIPKIETPLSPLANTVASANSAAAPFPLLAAIILFLFLISEPVSTASSLTSPARRGTPVIGRGVAGSPRTIERGEINF